MKRITLLKVILMVSQIAMCSKTQALLDTDLMLHGGVRSSSQIETASGLSEVCAELSQLSQACESPQSYAKVQLDNLMNACHVLSSTSWPQDGDGVVAAKKQVLKYFLEGSAPHTKVSCAKNFHDLEHFIVSEYTRLRGSQLYKDACIGQPNASNMLLGLAAVCLVSVLGVSFAFYRYMSQKITAMEVILERSFKASEALNNKMDGFSDDSSRSHHSSQGQPFSVTGQQGSMNMGAMMMYSGSRPPSVDLLRRPSDDSTDVVRQGGVFQRRRTTSHSSLSQVFPQHQLQPRTSTPADPSLNEGTLDLFSDDDRDNDSAVAEASVQSRKAKGRKKSQPKEKPTASEVEKPAKPPQKKASGPKRTRKKSETAPLFSDSEE